MDAVKGQMAYFGSEKPCNWIRSALVYARAMARKAPDVATFGAEIAAAYATKGDAIELGVANARRHTRAEAGVRLRSRR